GAVTPQQLNSRGSCGIKGEQPHILPAFQETINHDWRKKPVCRASPLFHHSSPSPETNVRSSSAKLPLLKFLTRRGTGQSRFHRNRFPDIFCWSKKLCFR
uniref:hypothetical protein n=1 Tax=Akkermansia muciniphila TaxID=239935 RepID=UPI003FD735B1